jgi:hypothetical protein
LSIRSKYQLLEVSFGLKTKEGRVYGGESARKIGLKKIYTALTTRN